LLQFEEWELRRISGPKTEEVVGGWIRLRNEELQNLYASPNIIRVIKSRERDGRGIENAWEKREVYTKF
jgi:hypothetical protein